MANTTTVSNPYNFNVYSNTTFSATINAVLPDKETILFKMNAGNPNGFINLTIPSGTKVVKVYCYAAISGADDSEVSDASVFSYINDKYNKTWAAAEITEDGTDEITRYVGVTPGKIYELLVSCNIGNVGSAYLSISYSSEINAHAVDVEDY